MVDHEKRSANCRRKLQNLPQSYTFVSYIHHGVMRLKAGSVEIKEEWTAKLKELLRRQPTQLRGKETSHQEVDAPGCLNCA